MTATTCASVIFRGAPGRENVELRVRLDRLVSRNSR